MKNLSLRQITLLAIFAAVVLTGLGYWAYNSFRWEEKEIDHGYSTEAKQNDFLAAEIFLQRHGVSATSIKNLSLLENHRWRGQALGPDDTIVLVNANKTLNQDRYDRLYEWVENGGTLIVSTQNPYIGAHTNQEDLLLRDFGVTPAVDTTNDFAEKLFDVFDNKDQQDDESDETNQADEQDTDLKNDQEIDPLKDNKNKTATSKTDEKPENHYRCNLDKEPTTVEFADEAAPLAFDFSRHDPFTFYDDSDEEIDDEEMESNTETLAGESEATAEKNTDNTSHMLYFDVGTGGITITSDTSIWTNPRIDCRDHAYALWRLVNHNGRVWFLTNQDAPSLTSIIWRNAPYGIIAALLALVLWLWAKSQRFGPVFSAAQTARRSLAEHIYASAMLLWRNQQHPQLLNLLRQQIIQRLQHHPQIFAASQQEQLIFLQELTGINREAIQRALYADNLHHPQDFANAIAHLQTIRKQL
ncbi:DUF4350 domain-containing protein [Cellvibrio fontiphilus]|jgi:hypothetical protein|uniref:DUF4350 domain-containing protein n=1 Tax=Cellvibrio fontiphilus TaxID=1815559 RepID=A0ABV7FF09_9GAMM